jgi:hypothetical protein
MRLLDLGCAPLLAHLSWWGAPLAAFGALCVVGLRLPGAGLALGAQTQTGAGGLPLVVWVRVFGPLWLFGVVPLLTCRAHAAVLEGALLMVSPVT